MTLICIVCCQTEPLLRCILLSSRHPSEGRSQKSCSCIGGFVGIQLPTGTFLYENISIRAVKIEYVREYLITSFYAP